MVVVPLIFGLVIGSFLNVVIVRLPEGRSIWRPRSSCPGCGTPIAWYDNIPLLSFALLRGSCRRCGRAIALRYPLVEAATGALFALAFLVLGPTPDFLVAAAFLAALPVPGRRERPRARAAPGRKPASRPKRNPKPKRPRARRARRR